MKKRAFYLLTFFCVTSILQAQEEVLLSLPDDSVTTGTVLFPESLDVDVDSLLHTWHAQYFARVDDYCHDDEQNADFPDSVYRMRLESLPNIINLPYNKTIQDCINLYASKRRSLVRYMLGMADFYFPVVEQILEENGLPQELKYLAVIESALNPTALSRVGASGLWQFMLPTGKSYGLTINSLVDERRDPVESTRAACRYFKDMYEIYEDWALVIAAYNCGPGNVNKALRRANGKTDFWDIFQYLPRETRSYVPLFIAANYIMNFYCEHNLCPVRADLPLATDTVMVGQMLHFGQVSEVLNVDMELIRALNPQYRRDIVPGSRLKAAVLKLPALKSFAFAGSEDSIYLHKAEELLANCIPFNPSDSTRTTISNRERITHTAASGENLYTIANQYGITARDIRRWNGLGSNRVARGKRLTLYVDNGGVKFASAAANTQTAAPAQETVKGNDGKEYNVYTVQSGDSLYSISKKYPGISASNIQQANSLPNSNIHPGQILKIPKT